MAEAAEMGEGDPRDEIARLEEHAEQLAARIENCQKFILASRVAIALGGVLLLGIVFGAIRFDAMLLIAAIVAVLGGFVLSGSNGSTLQEAAAQMAAAEARRAELIDQIGLRVVGERGTIH